MNFITRHPVLLVMLAGASVLSYLVYAKVADEPQGGFNRFGGGGAPLVEVVPVTLKLIADEVESVGTTVANESVDLTASVSEIVSKVGFQDGDFVEQGRILVELTNTSEASRLAEAQANVDDAKRQMSRLQNLSNSDLVADNEFDQARTNLETANARLEGVLVDMDDRLVRAPFSGFLGFRNVSEGTLLTPGMVITTLDDVSVIKLDFTIPEVYLAQVGVGQEITARSIVYKDQQFKGVINVVGSRIDPVTRGVSIRAQIDNPDLRLRPGMLMTVALALNEERVLVVPERSVIASLGQQFVYTVGAENRVSRVSVGLGRRRDGLVEITEGLQVGDQVISEGVIRVRPGLTVRTGSEEPAQSGRPQFPRGAGNAATGGA
ncbi:MAG: efflux RND transporter periplasmic adaptor subunit [Gammaproteobacteria bacterium]|nr:efflux RND transporter periplasmic adaptor subunit [Gammaproteobacteria bacterium]MDG2339120.1 efflux RND transporter periplasmic adaptor subunit [Gammaproteobacteria bacterium]